MLNAFRRTKDKPEASPASAGAAAADAASSASPAASDPTTPAPPPAPSGVKLLASVPAPPLDVRWVHTGSKVLGLPTVPVAGIDTVFRPFSVVENTRLEAAWAALPSEKRKRATARWGRADGEWGLKSAQREDKHREQERKKEEKARKKGQAGKVSAAGDVSSRASTPAGSAVPSDAENPDACSHDHTHGSGAADQYRSIMDQAQNNPERFDVVKGVPVAQDSLFEVDLETLSLHPVFWPQTGARIPVLRGTWFMSDETKPCTWDLAKEIEDGYQRIKPWLPSYQDELATARTLGPAAEEKLKHPLSAKFGEGLGVLFEDEDRCRIITSGAFDYLSRYIWSSIGGTPGGTYIYRGFNAAATTEEAERARDKAARDEKQRKKKGQDELQGKGKKEAELKDTEAKASNKKKDNIAKSKEPETARDEKDAVAAASAVGTDPDAEKLQSIMNRVRVEFEHKKKSLEEANAPVIHARNDDEPCTDLILVIHGIGQHLAAQYESFSFIYASNQLRQVLRTQSCDPALASVARNRRIQILPVQWRANLQLDSDDCCEDTQNERDNVFTIADITIGTSIPYVRQITNSVLLDIPLFMSEHKSKMIAAVCQQANRAYRMWIARHPDFEKHGRVHIIGHSLGSALAAEILSHQPTTVPPISQLPKEVITETTNRFLFNTHNLYLAGSPLGIFLQLQQAHLIARAGRPRTMHSAPDESFTFAGRFGCMAVDNLYNIFYPSDPVAYAVNAAVDVKAAKERPPVAIPAVTTSVFPSLPPLPSMPSMPRPQLPGMPKQVRQYLPAYFADGTADTDEDAAQTEIELVGGPTGPPTHVDPDMLAATRGARRFAALNSRGAVDYALPSSGVSDYIDMITAHGNYWNDSSFGAFVLNETFASAEDAARTATGPDNVIPTA